jgi:serine protease
MRAFRDSNFAALLLMLVASIGFTPAAQAKPRIQQIVEDAARTRRLPATDPVLAAPVSQICEPGAKWIRLGFSDLTLGSYDTLTLTSDGGDSYTFEGQHWNNRSFHARALRGSCVNIHAYFGHPDSRYRIDSYQFSAAALDASEIIVAGAGDICDSTPADCGATSDLVVAINPAMVFTAGDNAYTSGTLTEYTTRYGPTWGRFKDLTSPTPGNHDYLTTGASGYFDYFNGAGAQTGPAGDRSKGYYSFDVGEWHFIALNTMSGSTISSTQLAWLDQDLAANTKPCTAAYFHHPLVSRGIYTGSTAVKPIYDRLYAAKADLVLVGHDHNYQRYAKMTPDQVAADNGLRQIIVGTGGRDFYALSGTHPLLRASQDDTWGVLKLTLTATGYSGEFVPVAGKTWTDSFSGTCNNAPSPNTLPTAGFGFTASNLTVTFSDSSSDSDGSVVSRNWNFGDGITSTSTNPSHTYAAAGTYDVTLTVTDDDGASDSITKAVTVTAANIAPTANFSISTSGLTATFTNKSTDSDGTIVARSWNFGDGTSSTSTNPTHTYASIGTYNVTLTVTDDDGAKASITRAVPTLTLSGTLYRVDGLVRVDLAWTGARTTKVDLFRNSRKLLTTTNDGAHTDLTGFSGTGKVTYRVCESGKPICSRVISLNY